MTFLLDGISADEGSERQEEAAEEGSLGEHGVNRKEDDCGQWGCRSYILFGRWGGLRADGSAAVEQTVLPQWQCALNAALLPAAKPHPLPRFRSPMLVMRLCCAIDEVTAAAPSI